MRDQFGFVHLRGIVVFETETHTPIVNLPEGFRPEKWHEFVVACAGASTPCSVVVTHDGDVFFEKPISGSGNNGWNSLDGVTFLADLAEHR